MKRYTLLSILDSLVFPLHEALAKQLWWLAQKKRKEGFDVSIILLSENNGGFTKDGIVVEYRDKKRIRPLRIKSDYIHFINSVVSPGLFTIVFSKGYKILTLTDGYIWGRPGEHLRKFLGKLLPFVFDEIELYSNYQKKMLGIKTAKVVSPVWPVINNEKKYDRDENPTILYMGHLSSFKGVDTIIRAFRELVPEFPKLKWIIANNMVRADGELIEQIDELRDAYPDNIVIKGIVDPIEELSKTWVYVYPFKEPGGTMAYPLSLYESLKCNTPFIACDVGANAELFGKKYLISPDDHKEMAARLRVFFHERINSKNL